MKIADKTPITYFYSPIHINTNKIKWTSLLIFLLHIQVHLVKCDIKSNKTNVTTPLGIVQGYFERSWKNRPYKCFTGIPYAQPPIDKLRFEPPVPLSKLAKIVEATSLPPLCPQYEQDALVGKEDCLYLNIYVPVVNKEAPATFPVLFWIHGGAFKLGASSKLKAKYLMDRDIILVTINYRLEVLGFLSTGDHVIPGNMGLKDQNLALQWVSKNIKYFGGDPKQVTLGGVSAGAVSVHYHYLSPMSTGLFQNGISFSGCALDPWASTTNSSDTFRKLATALKCPMRNTTTISECLKTKSMAEMMQASKDVSNAIGFHRLIFLPVVENVQSKYFIHSPAIDIIKGGKMSDLPWITGIVEKEGVVKTSDIYTNEEMAAYVNKNWETVGGDLISLPLNVPKTKWAHWVNLARQHYLGSIPISTDTQALEKLSNLIGNYIISLNAQRAAKIQSGIVKSPVYFYYYTYKAAGSGTRVGPSKNITLGVAHGDDTGFVFENNGIDPTTTENDRAMLEEVLDNWYSIISTRKPNVGVPWIQVNSSADFKYMHIAGPGKNEMVTNNNLAEIQFWTSIGL